MQNDRNNEELAQHFRAWLLEDDARQDAFDDVERVWTASEVLKSSGRLAEMREEALAVRPRFPVLGLRSMWRDFLIQLNEGRSLIDGSRGGDPIASVTYFCGQSLVTRGHVLSVTMFLFSSLLAVYAFGLPKTVHDPVVEMANVVAHETRTGEVVSIAMPDGSQLTLNTDTKITVDYSKTERNIILERGQVLFDIAKDEARPFSVVANREKIVAIGTVFDVNAAGKEFTVTLLEGRVAVVEDAARLNGGAPELEDRTRYLTEGQQYFSSPKKAGIRSDVNVEALLAWREGRLIFSDTALEDAVAEVNRYTTNKIILDADLYGKHRITGVFRLGGVSGFVEALKSGYPVSSRETPDGTIKITKV